MNLLGFELLFLLAVAGFFRDLCVTLIHVGENTLACIVSCYIAIFRNITPMLTESLMCFKYLVMF
jgi:ABC-type arginine/histidine transport system permease subunit